MVGVPGLPQSTWQSVKDFFAGPVLDVAWKTLVVVAIFGVGYVLVAGGGVIGAIIGGMLLTMLIKDEVRQGVKDFLNRNWAEIPLPL